MTRSILYSRNYCPIPLALSAQTSVPKTWAELGIKSDFPTLGFRALQALVTSITEERHSRRSPSN